MPTGQQNIRAWSVGLDMAYAAGGMLLLGAGIDWLFGTKPWWMLGLGLLGLVVGMYKFIRDAMRFNRQSARQSASRASDRTGAGSGTGSELGAGSEAPDPGGDEKESG